jgi:excisionase family DNA binding protein
MTTKRKATRQPEPLPEWYTVDEAAKVLGVSRDTLDRMRRDGEIKYRSFGRLIRIPWYEVRAER